jgi:hypothetical protein
MTARKNPPQEVSDDNVVTDDELHERRVKKLIKAGVADMKSGKSPFFPMEKLIKAESDRLRAENDAFDRKHKKPTRKKRDIKKEH